MLTFMKKFLNNKDKPPNATSRSNSLPATSQRLSDKCYAMDNDILLKNQNEMPQCFSKRSSTFCEETKTSTNCNILQSTSISTTKTSIQGSFLPTDESSKENMRGLLSKSGVFINFSQAPCYDTSSSFVENPVITVAKSPDVCCCVLCNKARKECKKTKNVEDARLKVSQESKQTEGRTLREIYFEGNDCVIDENDDFYDHDAVLDSVWSEATQQYRNIRDCDLSQTPSFSTLTSTKSFKSSKISMKSLPSLSNQNAVHALQAHKTSLKNCDVDNTWPPPNHSPLSLPDGEEGFRRYQFGLGWIHSQTSFSFVKPPNVTIKHVE